MINRREALASIGAAFLAGGASHERSEGPVVRGLKTLLSTSSPNPASSPFVEQRTPRFARGPFRQPISRWCYGRVPLDDLCEAAKTIGYSSVELLDEKDWAVVKQHGLVCAMANGFGTIPVGFNRPDNHDKLVADATAMIPKAAAAG